MTRASLVAAVLVLVVRPAHAQGPAPDATQPPSVAPAPSVAPPGATAPVTAPSPAPPVEPPTTVDKGVLNDANAAHGWLTPTALTDPAGTWTVSDYELFLLSIGYSPTDQLSLSATTIPPITNDVPLWLLFSAKYQLLKAGRLRLAIQGAFTYFDENDDDTTSSDSFSAGDLGGAATVCLDADCNSHLSGFVGAAFARDTDNSVPFVASGTIVAALGKHVKLVGEVDSAFILGEVNDVANGALIWYGLRFTSQAVGVDVGFVRPIDVGDSGLLLGVPVVSISYRDL